MFILIVKYEIGFLVKGLYIQYMNKNCFLISSCFMIVFHINLKGIFHINLEGNVSDYTCYTKLWLNIIWSSCLQVF